MDENTGLPRCHLTVDVDPLRCYAEIHGVDVGVASNAVYDRAMLRFLDWLEQKHLRATFFVATSDLDDPRHGVVNRGIVREAARLGHEIASHTHSHPYHFDRLPPESQEREIERSVALIREATGLGPVGFRAPGYNVRPEMVPMLARHGIRYDASILPSVPYYLLRAAMLARIKLAGKTSGSQLGCLKNFASGPRPRILAHGGSVVREIPISVTPLGFPLVGTFLNLLGPDRLQSMLGFAATCDPLHLEFHGVDLLDLERDKLPPGLAVQRDLTIPLETKYAVLDRLADFVRGRFEVTTLAEAARAR
jgi:hypothetical protein